MAPSELYELWTPREALRCGVIRDQPCRPAMLGVSGRVRVGLGSNPNQFSSEPLPVFELTLTLTLALTLTLTLSLTLSLARAVHRAAVDDGHDR